MAQSKTEICNMALAHLGYGKGLSNVDTETTPEALALQMFWDYALRSVLRDIDWPFAKKTITMTKVSDNPTQFWQVAYRYPSDCVKIRRIPSAIYTDTSTSRIPYEEAADDTGTLIYCNVANAKLEYTTIVNSVTLFPPDMSIALSFLLASLAAPQVQKGEGFGLGDRCLKLYSMWKSNAATNAQNEIQGELAPEADSIRARS